MPEIEVPTEHLHETMEKHAHAAHGPHGGAPWIQWVALSAAVLAVLAAVSALLAGHHEAEAVLDQIKSANGFAYYQAKSIKSAVLETRQALEADMGKQAPPEVAAKIARYETEMEEIKHEADADVVSSKHHLEMHQSLARTVTLFQVAIALAAIAVLSRRKFVWYTSLALGAVGLALFVLALTGAGPAHG